MSGDLVGAAIAGVVPVVTVDWGTRARPYGPPSETSVEWRLAEEKVNS